MKKVLIVSYNFPPFNDIASRRFGEMVEYFEEFDWDPYLLTTKTYGDLSVNLEESKVYRIGDLRSSNNMKVEKNISTSRVSLIRRKLGFSLRLFDSTFYSWFLAFKKTELIKEFEDLDFDVILASYGPGSSLFLGNYISSRTSKPWIADFRDLGALYDEVGSRNYISIFFDKIIEKVLIKNTLGVTTVSNALLKKMIKFHKIENHCVVYNGFIENCTQVTNVSNNLYYAGRFYREQMNSVFILLDFLVINPHYKFNIRSLGPEILENEIIKYAKERKVLSQINILAPAEMKVINEEASSAFINIVFESLDTTIDWKKGVLTGKLMGLLTFSRPILAIARGDSEIGYVLDYTKKGKCLDNLAQVTMFIKSVENNNKLYIGEKASIDEFSRRMQAKKLCEFMHSVVDNHI